EEVEIVRSTTRAGQEPLRKVLSAQQILAYQALVLRVPADDDVVREAVTLVRRTRPADPSAPDYVRQHLSRGAGPRARQSLILAGKARAVLRGESAVRREDIRALAAPILRHRLLTNFQADARQITTDSIITRLVEELT